MSKLEFKKVTYDDANAIKPYLGQIDTDCADYSMGIIMLWKDFLGLEFCIYEDTFFMKGTFNGCERFYIPCGKLSLEDSFSLIFDHCKQNGIEPQFVSVPKTKIDEISKFIDIEYSESRDYSDYVYKANDLAKLSGRTYHQKRNHIAKFKKNAPNYRVVEITDNTIELVKEFYLKFQSKYPAESKSEIIERTATQNAIDYYDKIGLFGIFLELDEKVIAFTFGEVKNDILFVHIEKADREISGSYPVINNEFVKFCVEKYGIKWVNREDDSGDEGLRKAKLSYKPDHLAVKGKMKFMM